MSDVTGNIVRFTPVQPDLRPTLDRQAYAWPDYIHDQHRVLDLVVHHSTAPCENAKTRATALLKTALSLAMAEGVSGLELEAILTDAVLAAPVSANAAAAKVMVEVLAYGATRQLRLDVMTKEEIARIEKTGDTDF